MLLLLGELQGCLVSVFGFDIDLLVSMFGLGVAASGSAARWSL